MAQKLTIRFVETVKAKRQRSEHRDGHTRGLVLRVTPNGGKSWAVVYRRKSDGRKRRYTIGTYPEFSLADARTQAEAVVALFHVERTPLLRFRPAMEHSPLSNSLRHGSYAMAAPTRALDLFMTINSCSSGSSIRSSGA